MLEQINNAITIVDALQTLIEHLGILFGASGVVAHALALVPSDKLPPIVAKYLQLVGGNYGNAKNSQ